MRRVLTICVLLLVAGCSQQKASSEAADEAANSMEAPPAEVAVPSLEGQWEISATNGRPVAGSSAMAAAFNAGKVRVSSGCLRRAWTYTQKRNAVSFTANPGESANCGGGVPSADQEAAYVAMDLATMVIFNKDGREASLSGNGGGITLERRSPYRLARLLGG